jgi:ketosteroid isomerase-like protein
MRLRTFLAVALSAWFATLAHAAPKPPDFQGDKARVEAIFAAHDRLQPGLDEYMKSVADDIILMPNGASAIEGKPAYLKHVREFYASGTIQIRHQIIEVYSYPEVVIVRGRAVGSYTPPGGQTANTFETKNLFVLRRLASGELRVWQIIFNDAPAKA